MKILEQVIILNTGTRMPRLGFGTWKLPEGGEAINATFWALEAGYRHIDTARIYGNERSVGAAIQKSSLLREDIFVTTKLWNDDHDRAEQALRASLERLGLKYVDLYLIHWPGQDNVATWQAMERLMEAGLCLSIGISNFSVGQMEEILKYAGTPPAVNQIEFHPWQRDLRLLDFCKEHGIAVTAYSPLGHGDILDEPHITDIARRLNKTPAQIALRWSLQHGTIVIPKSARQDRIKTNADIFGFELSAKDMATIDALGGRRP